MTNILIDSDIILDFFFDREPFAEHAGKILSLCESKIIHGYLTPITISNVYYLLRKTTKHEIVVDKLKMLLSITDISITDKDVIFQALNSEFTDFEDALQNFSALKSRKVNIILTRNIKDYRTSTLDVMTPENYLKLKVEN